MKKQLNNLAFIFCVILLAGFNSYATDYTRLMDFDGDGKTDVGVYDAAPYNGNNVLTYFRYKSSMTGQTVAIQWGRTTDTPVPADYDGDGMTDAAIFRTWDSFNYPFDFNQWWIKPSSTGNHYVAYFGPKQYEGDRVPGDYDGDGLANQATYFVTCDYGDPSDPTDNYCQRLYGFLLSNGESVQAQIVGYSTYTTSVGGGIPAPGDYDADGATNIAIFNQAEQKFRVFAQPYSMTSENVIKERVLDIDYPAPGDFNGDGRTDFSGVKNFQSAVTQPLIWRIKYNLRTGYEVTYEIQWGMSYEFPVPGDYDGDGKTDIAVYNKSNSTWTIRKSSDYSTMTVVLGDSNDVPTTFPVQNPRYFIPFPTPTP